MGALTSKPYAFSSRPWELKGYESIDLSDSIGSNVRLDVGAQTLVRIVPQRGRSFGLSGDFITDKIRFSYDSLHLQRLQFPFFRYSVSSNFSRIGWVKVTKILKTFSSYFEEDINVFVNNFVTLDTLVLLKHFFGSRNVISLNSAKRSNDFQDWYSICEHAFISNITGSKKGFLFLLAFNLRLEAPKIGESLREVTVDNQNLVIYSSGSNFPYVMLKKVINVGPLMHFSHLLSFGFHKLVNRLMSRTTEFVYFLISERVSNDFFLFMDNISERLSNFFFCVDSSAMNSVYCTTISTSLNSVSSSDLGLCNNGINKYRYSLSFSKSMFSLFEDNFSIFNSSIKNNFVVYCGSHGERCAANQANLVVPLLHTYESYFRYYNMFSKHLYIPNRLPTLLDPLPTCLEFFKANYKDFRKCISKFLLSNSIWWSFAYSNVVRNSLLGEYCFGNTCLLKDRIYDFSFLRNFYFLFSTLYEYVCGALDCMSLNLRLLISPFSFLGNFIFSNYCSFSNSFYPSFLMSDSFFRSSHNLSVSNARNQLRSIFFCS